MANKIGAGQDFLKVTLAGLPSDAGKIARLNVQPGIGVFDLVTPGLSARGQVIVDGKVGGKQVKSTFNIAMQDGLRLILSELSDPGRLKVGTIDTILGEARNFRLIKRQ